MEVTSKKMLVIGLFKESELVRVVVPNGTVKTYDTTETTNSAEEVFWELDKVLPRNQN